MSQSRSKKNKKTQSEIVNESLRPSFFSYFNLCENLFFNQVFDEETWKELVEIINDSVTKDKRCLGFLFNYLRNYSEKVNIDFLVEVLVEIDIQKRKESKFRRLSRLWRSYIYLLLIKVYCDKRNALNKQFYEIYKVDKDPEDEFKLIKCGRSKIKRKWFFKFIQDQLSERLTFEPESFDYLWGSSQKLHPLGVLLYKKLEF